MSMSSKDIAKICHEVNRAYCQAIGDMSQLPWDGAPAWQQESAISGVEFHRHNPDASASASHDNWLKEKLSDGWKYGPVKDPDKKEHPCCVPYEQLPQHQQAKDYIFKSIVEQLRNY